MDFLARYFLVVCFVSACSAISGAPRQNRFLIEDFGAVGDGVTLNTEAFKNAVAAIKQAGDGFLQVSAGDWLTGPFNFTSHMTLFLDAGATILGSDDMSLYQLIEPLPSYGQGRDHPGPRFEPLIGGTNEEDIIITGNNGTIDGQGQVWWDLHNSGDEVFTRGPLVEFSSSSDIVVEKVTLQNSPFWTVHPWNCERLLFSQVTILAPPDSPNTDGIDPDSCVDVRIEDSYIQNGDDGIALKSGWDCFGIDFGKPTKNVFIRNVTSITSNHGGVSIGSEMSGGVENVFVTDSHFIGSGLRIKTNPTRGGFIRNIFWNNILVDDNEHHSAIEIATDYGDPNPNCPTISDTPVELRGFFYNNVTATFTTHGLRFFGSDNDLISSVFLNDISVTVDSPSHNYDCQFVHGAYDNLFPDPTGVCDGLTDAEPDESADVAAGVSEKSSLSEYFIGGAIGVVITLLTLALWSLVTKEKKVGNKNADAMESGGGYIEM